MAKAPAHTQDPEMTFHGPLWEEMAHTVSLPGHPAQPATDEGKAVAFTLHHLQDIVRGMRARFDHSHPVDEYISSQGAPISPVMLQPSWDMPVRIESILAVIPIGVQTATLQLGDRFIGLLNASAPITSSVTVNLQGLGIVIDQDSDRFLTLNPAPANGPFLIEIMGWADEIFGNA